MDFRPSLWKVLIALFVVLVLGFFGVGVCINPQDSFLSCNLPFMLILFVLIYVVWSFIVPKKSKK